jgi:uncharacterized protein YacL
LSGRISTELSRFAPPLIFGGLGFFYLAHSSDFADPTSGQAPQLYAKAIIGLATIVSVIAIVQALQGARRGKEESLNAPRAAFIFATIAGFIALIFAVGFYVAVPLFLFSFLYFVARMKVGPALIGAFIGFSFLWGIFGQLLHMRVFPGLLF